MKLFLNRGKTMNNDTKNLLDILKSKDEDFEWYPTTDNMLQCVFMNLKHTDAYNNGSCSILDIGAGKCALKKFFQKNGEDRFDYYAIEKSKTLISLFDSDVICLGCDFDYTTLIDKQCDIYFCNPPYSEYEKWVVRILREGNFREAYFVIPERWNENNEIKEAIEKKKIIQYNLGNFDFLNAERQARARVQVVRFSKPYKYNEDETFDSWFDETFKMEERKISDYNTEKEDREKLKNQLVNCKNKGQALVELYNKELLEVENSFKTISSIPVDILADIGVNKKSVCCSLKMKLSGLKMKYWKEVFDNLDEITSRLTVSSREKLMDRFRKINQVDFCEENILAVLIWVIKNANKYYDEQLVELFKEFSDKENVKPYKSNKRLFEDDGWRWRSSEHSHYTLDYRLIVSKYGWVSSYSWEDSLQSRRIIAEINDICVVARNLVFDSEKTYEEPKEFNHKYYVYMKNGEFLFEYKVFKNGNAHFKLNTEFSKAFNVEASRILGWVRSQDEIREEFDKSLSGCEKYFKCNLVKKLENNKTKMLGFEID